MKLTENLKRSFTRTFLTYLFCVSILGTALILMIGYENSKASLVENKNAIIRSIEFDFSLLKKNLIMFGKTVSKVSRVDLETKKFSAESEAIINTIGYEYLDRKNDNYLRAIKIEMGQSKMLLEAPHVLHNRDKYKRALEKFGQEISSKSESLRIIKANDLNFLSISHYERVFLSRSFGDKSSSIPEIKFSYLIDKSFFDDLVFNFLNRNRNMEDLKGFRIVYNDENLTHFGNENSIKNRISYAIMGEIPMDIFIDISSIKLIKSLYYIFIIFAVLFLILFFISRRILKNDLQKSIGEIELLNKDIKEISNKDYDKPIKITGSDEIKLIRTTIEDLRTSLIKHVADTQYIKIARQVAHDIRSPLAALDSAVVSLDEVEESRRVIFRMAVNRIRDIANNLFNQNKIKEKELGARSQCVFLPSLIQEIITEKRALSKTIGAITFNFVFQESNLNQYVKIESAQMKRVISNIIDNSIDAINDDFGQVVVALNCISDKSIKLTISDNGKGIPKEIIDKVFQEGFSYAKTNGVGLGLYHAHKEITRFGGSIEVKSSIGEGTHVVIVLPLTTPPKIFVNHIELNSSDLIVIVDDDYSIHEIWKLRLNKLKEKYKIKHFYNPKNFCKWVQSEKDLKAITFFVDYEFLGFNINGIDIITKHLMNEHAYLVTSYFDEPKIIQQCLNQDISIINKSMTGFIPIGSIKSVKEANIQKIDPKDSLVLIDDDELVHQTWDMMAKQKGQKLFSFYDVDSFMQEANSFPKNINIYVDSYLKFNLKGEEESKKIKDLGFENIHLASGEVLDELPVWIKSQIGKSYPDFNTTQ